MTSTTMCLGEEFFIQGAIVHYLLFKAVDQQNLFMVQEWTMFLSLI